MKKRENLLAIISGLVSIALAVFAYYFRESNFAASLLLNLATTALGLAIAIILINVYLDMQARRDAVGPLLNLISPALAKNHNELIREAWNRFGKPQFGEIIKRFKEN